MSDHDHDHHDHHHHHDHDHSELSETELRVRALETILTEKGYVDPAALDAIIQAYETKIGPHNGAQVVAKAWTDPAFKQALLDDASEAVSTLGHVSRVGDHLVAVENTPQRHNMVVCTLCSCYPWEMLGLPPVWYKAAPYRSRAVKDPRGVLADFGVSLPKETEIRVWDSTAETRFLVLPMRPEGTDGWSEAAARRTRHARLHDRHGISENAGSAIVNGVHDMGGMDGFGKVEPEPNEPMFHTEWEARVLAMVRAMGAAGAFNIDTSRFYREMLPPHVYLASSYYKKWFLGLEDMLVDKGFIAARGSRRRARGAAAETAQAWHVRIEVMSSASWCAEVWPPGSRRREIQGGRSRAREEHSPGDPHAAAALCARPCRRGRARSRLPCVSGYGRDGGRREPAMALHGRVRRRRIVGPGRRSDREDIHRRV